MRFKIHVNGKWRGDSYSTQAQAEAAAKLLPKDQKIEVLPKGEPLAPKPKK